MKRLIAKTGWSPLTPLALILIPLLAIIIVGEVDAQCGSSASSCKTCHEVNAKDPVNAVGDWHVSHAFGDFCEFCHAGNVQASDETAAHEGMIAPLSDPKGSCQSCHADDYLDKAQVYASVLNVSLGSASSAPAQATAQVAEQAAATSVPVAAEVLPTVQSTGNAPVATPANVSVMLSKELDVNDPNLVDYAQRYNEIVLGQRRVNWGNIVVFVLIVLVAAAGGGFVVFNEIRLRIAASEMRKVEGEYPADVVEMLPAIAALQPPTRRSLRSILNRPGKAERLLGVVANLIADDKSEE